MYQISKFQRHYCVYVISVGLSLLWYMIPLIWYAIVVIIAIIVRQIAGQTHSCHSKPFITVLILTVDQLKPNNLGLFK
jgi:hypothetical protein